MAQTILFGLIGANGDDDRHSNGYYMVEFSSHCTPLKKRKIIMGKSLNVVNY